MLARGEAVGALAATEPGGGSALPHAVACHARLDNDWWILSGEKLFITNGPIADVVFVLARTSSDPGPFSLSLFAVPSSTAGFEMTRTLDKLGCRSSPTAGSASVNVACLGPISWVVSITAIRRSCA